MKSNHLFILACLISMLFICIEIKSQTYNIEEQKSYLGYIRIGEEVVLNENKYQLFSFNYLPGGGDKPYAQAVCFYFSSQEEDFVNFLRRKGKEIYSIKVIMDDGTIISHSYDVAEIRPGTFGRAPIEGTFTDKGFGVACALPMIKLNNRSFTFTSKTKVNEVMEWNGIFKIRFLCRNIKSIEIVASSINPETSKKERKEFNFEFTKPTTYIFKSLIYDYKP